MPGLYVAGWLKRGPSGIIGTNISDAQQTATALILDWQVLRVYVLRVYVRRTLHACGGYYFACLCFLRK
jgi:hypothetical protein